MSDVDRNKEAVRRHFAALNSGDYTDLPNVHDPSGRNHAPGPFDLTPWPPEGKPFGPNEVRETFEWLHQRTPQLTVIIEDLLAEGDEVVAWLRYTATQAGRPIDFHHAHRFRLRDGLIVEHWAVRDDLRAFLQAGVIIPPAGVR